ncbi:hypothetical protein EV360DRAFT_55824, partial [Lentinula raphanica]
GPFFYRTQDAPTYHLGIGSMLVSNCLEVLIFVALRVYLSYRNRKRDAADLAAADSGMSEPPTRKTFLCCDETAFADMTDLQNVK